MEEQRRQIGRRAFMAVAGAAAVGLAGCSGTGATGETTTATARADAGIPSHGGVVGYTYQRPTGNRVVAGEGAVPEADPIDVSVDWTPAWVVGVSGTGTSDNGVSGTSTSGTGEDRGETASWWAIVGESGEVAGVRIRDGEASTTEIAPNEIPAGTPPVLRGGRPPEIPISPACRADSAQATHPVPF